VGSSFDSQRGASIKRGGTSFDSTGSGRSGSSRPSNVSRKGSVTRLMSVGTEPNQEMVTAGLQLHYVKHDTSTQECLDMNEVTKHIYI
jgi:hypothetical protein